MKEMGDNSVFLASYTSLMLDYVKDREMME